MKKCKDCANYVSHQCSWEIDLKRRKQIIVDYNYDCWTSEEDKWLCDMMCGAEE